MSIKRMLLLASMALAAIAFAAPAVAQGNITLTDEGIQLKEGAEVTATSTNLTTFSGAGALACEQVTLHLELTNPGPEHLVLKPLGEATTKGCREEFTGAFVTITDGTLLGDITINTWGTSEETEAEHNEEVTSGATFNADFYSDPEHKQFQGACHFATDSNGDVHVEATTPDVIDVRASLVSPFCETEGHMTGSFTLETSDETQVNIDFEETE